MSDGLNRVILLSDGLANVGLTDPNVIAAEARALAARGVSTTTMGLGDDYNEDLMQELGESGDGNYYYIESPVQLADIFQTEMKGLMANVGRKVSLGIEPLHGGTVVEVLNDLDRNSLGRLMLPNLVVGMPIQVVVRLKLTAAPRKAEHGRFRLAWDDPKGGKRHSVSLDARSRLLFRACLGTACERPESRRAGGAPDGRAREEGSDRRLRSGRPRCDESLHQPGP